MFTWIGLQQQQKREQYLKFATKQLYIYSIIYKKTLKIYILLILSRHHI